MEVEFGNSHNIWANGCSVHFQVGGVTGLTPFNQVVLGISFGGLLSPSLGSFVENTNFGSKPSLQTCLANSGRVC